MIAKAIAMLFFFCLLLSASSSTVDYSQTNSMPLISSFLKKAIDIDVYAMDKFLVKSPDKDGRMHIEIENGNKKIKIVLLKPTKIEDDLKLMFME